MVDRFRFEPAYLIEPETDLDHIELVLVLMPPCAGAQVLTDRQAGAVEIMEHEDGKLEVIGEPELGLDRLPFVADDRDVESLSHARRDQQLGDAVLLNG